MNYLTLTFSKQKKKLLKLKILFQKLKKRLKKATMLVGHSLAECSAELRRERIEDKKQPRLRSCEALTVPVLIQLDDGDTLFNESTKKK